MHTGVQGFGLGYWITPEKHQTEYSMCLDSRPIVEPKDSTAVTSNYESPYTGCFSEFGSLLGSFSAAICGFL